MSQENVEIVRKLYEHWGRGEAALDFFDPNVEFARIGPGMTGDAGEWRGLAEMFAAVADYLDNWEDLRITAERLIDLDDQVLVLSRQTGRGKRGAVPFDQALADLFTLRDGKIVRYASYWERAEALEAAGLREEDLKPAE